VYGGAAHALLVAMTLCFVVAVITSGAVWMIGSDRIQAVAAYDGAFIPFFGRFNRALGTPVRVNVLSGVVSSIFCVVALAAFNGGENAKFQVVLDIAISTTLISYLWIFPAVLKLRYSHPDVERPYRHPWGLKGLWVSTVLVTGWILLGSWEAVFPDTLERLFGVGYTFGDTWGVGQGTFEALTLGTLGVIVVVGVIGYFSGSRVRAETVSAAPAGG
jgi:amino acid transporter